MYKINNQDVNVWSKEYEGEKFHALFCDAPYHLTTITKRFGKEGSAPAKFGTDGAFGRVAKGFMGQEWDGGDVAFRPETWEGMKKHLFPGAFGMTFGGSRTAHRIAIAIEDAGFIIHPMIFWCYATGFPKATRVKGHPEFDGHRYGLQALKPAGEPIIVFQKPYEGKPVDNIVATGAGAINIDGGRIPLNLGESYDINRFDDGMKPFGNGAGHKYSSSKIGNDLSQIRTMNRSKKTTEDGWGMNDNKADTPQVVNLSGRWPANFIISDSVSSALDAQSGHLKSGKMSPEISKRSTDGSPNGIYGKFDVNAHLSETYGDSGGASRFFFNVQTNLDDADPFIYNKKVSPKERNAGLDELPIKLGGSLAGGNDKRNNKNVPQLHPTKNPHPTLKPISLTQYLSTLLLPPIEYAPRRLLIPFSGVSSEMIGALLAGWEYVEGIEMGEEYCDIGEKRIQHWCK